MLIDRDFFAKLDQPVLGCAPWANGMFDALSGEMRPLMREDMVSMTTGYDLIRREDVPAEAFEKVEGFYKMLFPRKDEMAIFRQVIANALFGVGNAKHFLVLSDLSGGNNGKTTLMTLVESVFGSFAAGRNRNLLMSSQRLDPCAHQGDILAYAGKRIGFVDEPPMGGTLDVARIKDLTSGASKQTGRGVGSAKVMTFVWRALIVLSANQASFPQMNATSDEAFLRRMIALVMRAKFVDAGTPRAVGERLTHTIDVNVLDKLRTPECLSAHVHILADSFRQYTAANGVITLTAESKRFVMTIACESDPLFPIVEEFLQGNIELATDGWIQASDLRDQAWQWMNQNYMSSMRRKKSHFVDLLFVSTKRLSDSVQFRVSMQVDGECLRDVFTGVRIKHSIN
jgi:phage/plasmid-associated DNA primase